MNATVPSINNRYTLEAELGWGGMGVVYRAKDRLTQRIVALKRLHVPVEYLHLMSLSTSKSVLESLAHEFEVLASIRHPNIISVLDYGFDSAKNPYLTMELLEDAQTIVEVGSDLQLDQQIGLVLQLLEALSYLHRRGVIHRDLKPDNVLFSNGQVSVLDFGLSIARNETALPEGTLGYMAPEMLCGGVVTEAADLYAVGVMLYEMITGILPLYSGDIEQMTDLILNQPPNFDSLPQDIGHVVRRLLLKHPYERYANASEVINELSRILGREVEESKSIRDSFLQAAPFVGRDWEFRQLSTALTDAQNGKGSIWLVGGESGIGKSRLLQELRIQGMIQSVQVLYGQGISGGGLPYQLWRDIMRRAVFDTPLSDLEAGILKEIVPDLETLLERPIPLAPRLEGNAGQQRLLQTITGILARTKQPLLLLLEDLQWAVESLQLIDQLVPLLQNLPIMIVGSYRIEEKHELPDLIPDANVILLKRLSEAQIEKLTVSMLGESNTQAQVLDLLQRETEGNVFFLIEVVRALAESAGKLANIGRLTIPKSIFAGGVQQVIHQRLDRIPLEYRPLLKVAAVVGRQLDMVILEYLKGNINFQQWLTLCSDVAVLEVRNQQWQFAHDKFREALIQSLQ